MRVSHQFHVSWKGELIKSEGVLYSRFVTPLTRPEARPKEALRSRLAIRRLAGRVCQTFLKTHRWGNEAPDIHMSTSASEAPRAALPVGRLVSRRGR